MKPIKLRDYKIWVEPKVVRVHSADCGRNCAYGGDVLSVGHSFAIRRIEALLSGTTKRVAGYKVDYTDKRIKVGCSFITRTQLKSILKQINSLKKIR